jgi:hypothetical protein
MLEALEPMDLHAAAQVLGVHPFEVVRLQVMSGSGVGSTVARDTLDTLRTFGKIEDWWSGRSLPAGETGPAVARSVVGLLLERDRIGDRTTRLDNLWRGLGAEERDLAEQVVHVLQDLGVLTTIFTPAGVQASVHPEQLEVARGIAAGNLPREITSIWQG